jgi:hypothetical protein
VGKGFQYLPKGMKWACLARGYNYDIKSCQLELLRQELKRIGVSPKNLKRLETSYIMKELDVSEDDVKCFRFSTIFSAAFVSLSSKSVIRKRLNKQLGVAEASNVLKRWKKLVKPLRRDLKRLIDDYLSSGKTNRYGLCVRNAVGQNFNCTWKNVRKEKNGSLCRCAGNCSPICCRGWKAVLSMIMLPATTEYAHWNTMVLSV